MRILRRKLVVLLLAFACLAPAGCGESDEEKAQNQVCDARADIAKQVEDLGNLTITIATVDGVKESLGAIGDDLSEIRDAQDKLNEERKQQVQDASQKFASQVQSTLEDLGTNLSISGAKSQLQSSLAELEQSYRQTLAPIDCE